MMRPRLSLLTRHVLAFGALVWSVSPDAAVAAPKKDKAAAGGSQVKVTDVAGRTHVVTKKVTQAERKAAAERLKAKLLAAGVASRSGATTVAAPADATTAMAAPMAMGAPVGPWPLPGALAAGDYIVGDNGQLIPDYSGLTPNWAFSPPLQKFVDTLPDLKGSIAVPDTLTYPGSDYYEIDLIETTWQFHAGLPPTTVRIYQQVNQGTAAGCSPEPAVCNNVTPPAAAYLGPVIVAQRGRPVRVKFTNRLPTGAAGNLPIPVDPTVMGSGPGPNVTDAERGTIPADVMCQPAQGSGQIDTTKCFTQNRATIHLHGGVTPWISDGTTHQWITPTGETTAYTEGVSVYNVPDMPDGGKPTPGSGVQTFYWTNDQAARLMFYHDHAHGITRLNVYMGEAAGYLLRDDAEKDLEARGLIPGLGDNIPLVIQEKTFVDATTIGVTDPTWNWGTGTKGSFTDNKGKMIDFRAPNTGDLWWPHVYMPAQNPSDISGMNAMGRWNYGPWFYPPTPIPYGAKANPYFVDLASTPQQPDEIPGTPNPSWGAEAFLDTPVINGKAYPVLTVEAKPVRFRILNAGGDRFVNLQLYKAYQNTSDTTAGGAGALACGSDPTNCTEVKMVPAAPNTGLPANWPQDGRAGGAPDPATAGPSFYVIGTEGGFLPMPVEVKPQPVLWNQDPLTFNFGNVSDFSLLLGPAERADAIVDFSGMAGQTFILYNDAPAAFPASDPRNDYYTGNPDQTDTGGYTSTLPGYGPNTRTIMQIRVVAATGTVTPFSLPALEAAFTTTRNPDKTVAKAGVFMASQDEVVVGQPAYDKTYGKTFMNRPPWGLGTIFNSNVKFETVSGEQVTLLAQPKAIHDEMGATFDDYGRMKASLGVAMPNPDPVRANFIMQGYADPATELVKLVSTPIGSPLSDGTQIWRINHNGVDTHPIHFHLFHVQLINRVGWDGAYRLPHPTELGWKDTVRVSPLEDTYVALRPIAPVPETLPFRIPNSFRPFEPALSSTSVLNFIDPNGNAGSVSNREANFGWEYVWHCHILSHEENDMMRAVIFAATPETPTALTASLDATLGLTLSWTDNSLTSTEYILQKSDTAAFTTVTETKTAIAPCLAAPCARTLTDGAVTSAVPPVFFRVAHSNTVGSEVPGYPSITATSAWSNTTSSAGGPFPPVVTFTGAPLTAANGLTFTVTATTDSGVMPNITGTPGVCTVGAVTGSPSAASAPVTITASSGACSLVATWPTGGIFLAGTASQTTIATAAAPTVSFTGAPASAATGQSFTVTATTNASVIASITGAGACSVVDGGGGTALVTMTSGTGTCDLTANWAADTNYQAATAKQSTTAVAAAPTVSLVVPASAGYASTFTAVASTNASVLPTIAGTPGVCSVGLVGGTPSSASATVTMLAGTGTCVLTASWAADASYAAATTSGSTVASKAATAVSAPALTPSPSVVGKPVAVAFSVTPVVGAGPTGAVTVTASTGETCTGAAPAAGCTLTFPTAGTRTVTAAYAGDANFAPSTSPATSQLVNATYVVVSPNPLAFGDQLVGTNSTVRTVAVSNTGTTAVALGTLTFTGPFARSGGSCGTNVAAGATCTIGVRFSPVASGPATGQLSIPSTDAGSPAVVGLSGNGIAPIASASPAALTFSTALNVPSASQTVTVTNTGTAPLTISNVTRTGTNANQFAQTNNCVGSLAINATCTITVTFSPTAASPLTKTATLNVVVAAPATNATVALTGTILVPTFTVTPNPVAFGSQSVSAGAKLQTVTITNTGLAPLRITGISRTGGATSQFPAIVNTGCPTSPATLAAGASCSVTASFDPTTAGLKTTNLNVNVGAPATSQTVPMTGTGTTP